MVKVKLHGMLAEKFNKSEWELSVKSASEAIRAIEANTKVFFKTLRELDKQNVRYRVLINKNDFVCFKKQEDIQNEYDLAFNSNLITIYEKKELESIDIVPVIEGAGDVFGAVLGIIAIVAGAVLIATGVGVGIGIALVIGGIGLAAAGFINLMSSAPPYVAPEFSSPDVASPKGGGGKSYLFDGPSNTAGEGGPVPVGYGRLLIGSKTISASYNNNYVPGQVSNTDAVQRST